MTAARSRFFVFDFDAFFVRLATTGLRARLPLLACAVFFATAAFAGAFAEPFDDRSRTIGGVSAIACTGVATVTATARRSQRNTVRLVTRVREVRNG